MSRDGLGALCRRHGLDDATRARLASIAARLDTPEAPSTVSGAQAVLERHLADSLVVLDRPEIQAAGRLVDLGAGAGVPSLPLAAVLPDLAVVAVDATGRKCAFIEDVGAEAGLDNLTVVHARAEEWPAGLGRHDVACARAVAQLPVLLEYAAPLLREGGSFIAWKGAVEGGEREDARRAAGELGLELVDEVSVVPFRGADRRSLHIYVKAAPTPPRYPRRAGMATKRPLGATTVSRASADRP